MAKLAGKWAGPINYKTPGQRWLEKRQDLWISRPQSGTDNCQKLLTSSHAMWKLIITTLHRSLSWASPPRVYFCYYFLSFALSVWSKSAELVFLLPLHPSIKSKLLAPFWLISSNSLFKTRTRNTFVWQAISKGTTGQHHVLPSRYMVCYLIYLYGSSVFHRKRVFYNLRAPTFLPNPCLSWWSLILCRNFLIRNIMEIDIILKIYGT